MSLRLRAIEDIDVSLFLADETEEVSFRTLIGSKKWNPESGTLRFELLSLHDHSKEEIIITRNDDGDYLYKASFMYAPHEYYDIELRKEDGCYVLRESDEAEGDRVVISLYV